jgi:hypothetical protein
MSKHGPDVTACKATMPKIQEGHKFQYIEQSEFPSNVPHFIKQSRHEQIGLQRKCIELSFRPQTDRNTSNVPIPYVHSVCSKSNTHSICMCSLWVMGWSCYKLRHFSLYFVFAKCPNISCYSRCSAHYTITSLFNTKRVGPFPPHPKFWLWVMRQ